LKRKKMKIKTSNKILLIAGAVPILFIILLLITMRIIPSGGGTSQASSSGAADMTTRTLPLKGFSEISTKGNWIINLVQGDNFLVNISAPESVINEIKAENNGTKLVLDSEKFKDSKDVMPIKADITLPAVSIIDTAGKTAINLSSLNIDSISIRSDGPTNITGDKGMIRDLKLNGTGLLRMDLSSVPVTNADLECQGVYMIKLLMNGGRLSGNLEGMGTFNYAGKVSVNEIRKNGDQSKVVHQP
jgi:hypothetical protein